jgi:phosphoenolpyruvate carboxykinase (GTP)
MPTFKSLTKHAELNKWIKKIAAMCHPDRIVWIDGSEEQKDKLTKESIASGEVIELNQEKLPGCLYHRTALNDVARTEHLTFICTKKQKDAGPTNNWMPPKEAYAKASIYFKGSMKGRTMFVIPFSMGPVGSPFSKIGIELTDSIYVVLNMLIMTRVGSAVLEKLGMKGEFTRCLHSKADLDINKRLILHFPEDNAIWSVNSGYGGNVLLGKKCLALRIASYIAKEENWLAEHMLIMGVEDPSGYIGYVAAAFPSACGKTNLAMLIPPEGLKVKGYRIWTVGDDIAWMRIDTDGSLWAINPESGFFGVAPGTNSKTNPNAVATIQKNTIFTNVLLKKDKTVWWEGADGAVPSEGTDWTGKPWKPGMVDESGNPIRGANPNSRFTAPLSQCPSITNRLEHHHGVPISAIIFGGRRATTAPLVYEAFTWQHGVYIGSTMASERTAAQYGKQGEVRRDPMAMLPFCGYNMAEYFKHWLHMGKLMTRVSRIFHVNWFKTDEKGNFLWPGFGENLRILEWILNRCRQKVDAVRTPIGYIPHVNDIDMTGLKLEKGAMTKLFEVNKHEWLVELEDQKKFFNLFGKSMPKELTNEYKALEKRIQKELK